MPKYVNECPKFAAANVILSSVHPFHSDCVDVMTDRSCSVVTGGAGADVRNKGTEYQNFDPSTCARVFISEDRGPAGDVKALSALDKLRPPVL